MYTKAKTLKILSCLLILVFILSACLPSQSLLSETPKASTSTLQPSFTPKPTWTVPPTPTLYDPKNSPTLTPELPAQCPEAQPIVDPDLSFLTAMPPTWNNWEEVDQQRREDILRFINRYGPQPIIEYFQKNGQNSRFWLFEDITNDGIPEFMYDGALFQCNHGSYRILLSFTRSPWGGMTYFKQIYDGNHNGLPEIVVNLWTGNHGSTAYQIYEWDQDIFRVLLKNEIFTSPDGNVRSEDLDDDGVEEFILTKGTWEWNPPLDIELRNEITTFKWNGIYYKQASMEYDAPKYRFQAVQDADYFMDAGQYDHALELYKEVISNGTLDWWSIQRRDYNLTRYSLNRPAAPEQDWNEYHWLASYARFRLIVLYLMQGHFPEAESIYEETQKYSTPELPGYRYFKIGSEFWMEYLISTNLENACGKAIAYASEHPELLWPLGSDYHGRQSKIYMPKDVCPASLVTP